MSEGKTIWRSESYDGAHLELVAGPGTRLTMMTVASDGSGGHSVGSICPHEFIGMTNALYETFMQASKKKEAANEPEL